MIRVNLKHHLMLTAHKICLKPNNKQATYFARASGVARFSYNWALAEWNKQYAAWKLDNNLPKPSETALRRELNSIKKKSFPWMLEVTKNAPQMAIIQLGKAFKNFFDGHTKYPQFRKKGLHERFSLSNDQFSVDGSRIRIPHLGWVRMRESLRWTGKIMSATISRVADKWFVSITVDTPNNSSNSPLTQAENQGAVGVDLGISALATLSTGEVIVGRKPHKTLLCRLQRLSRGLSRKAKGSKNREKAKIKLARLHANISDIRKDNLHQLTSNLTRRFHTIGVENLNVKGMVKNQHLSRAISDAGFGECRRQLEYKSARRGGIVFVADRWFPSSKTCSCCGHKLDDLPLSTRSWTCPNCHSTHDRDVNAAINLKNLAVSSTVSGCGEDGSGSGRKNRVNPASVKQKVSFVPV